MTVRIEKSGPVWTIIHARPEARNAMDPASAEALYTAFLDFESDESASVAVFWGEGGAFCAGWDPEPLAEHNLPACRAPAGSVLTGRQVMAEECERIGLCEYVVEDGEARTKAEELAQQIAAFPQLCARADRRSVIAQHGLRIRHALVQEWYNSRPVLEAGGIEGAGRFASGAGRHGDFGPPS